MTIFARPRIGRAKGLSTPPAGQTGRLDAIHRGLSNLVGVNRSGGDLRLIGSLGDKIPLVLFHALRSIGMTFGGLKPATRPIVGPMAPGNPAEIPGECKKAPRGREMQLIILCSA
jgi:hypothetical protein